MSTKEAAEKLGISTSTFKRFCAAQGIKLVRTPGGHRRVDRCQMTMVSHLMNVRANAKSDVELRPDVMVQMLLNSKIDELVEMLTQSSCKTSQCLK